LTAGEYVREFEEEFAKYLKIEHVVGLNSCTAALHLSLLALGVKPGDEVVTTPMTFIATATPIIHCGAKPIFADVEPDTGLIDVGRIEHVITKRTKAIIPVHLYGQMCDMKRMREIADRFGLKIVEDAAHCIEGERDGIKPGQLSDVVCFSYYATKNITSGEGGAIATRHKAIAERIKTLRMHGMSKEAIDRYAGYYRHWDMIECGWKYNMDNIQAALLLPQLKKIDDYWAKRRQLYNAYVRAIDPLPGVAYPKIIKNAKSAYHLLTVWVSNTKRDAILKGLGDAGIGVAVNYRAIHLLRYFKDTFGFNKGDLPNAEDIGDRTLTLPFYIGLEEHEIDFVVNTLEKLL
jgi:UDP-4-amino-4-deoxy-L-arabinose-oxoglutarate aminotransferase